MSNSDDARAKARRGVVAVFDRYHALADQSPKRNGVPNLHDYSTMKNVELIDAWPDGRVLFKYTITQEFCNLNGVLHGGAAGVLFDMFTTTALGPLARPGFWDFMGGVTRAMNISYLRAVPVNTPVWFRSHVVSLGKTMALVRGEMTDESGKIVYATVDHHKVNVPSKAEHMKLRVPWDDEMAAPAAAAAAAQSQESPAEKATKGVSKL